MSVTSGSRFDADDLAALAAILRAAARAEILPRFHHLGPDAIRHKNGPLDLVTAADEAAERHITAALLARFPAARVVGEEAAAADPAVLGRLRGEGLVFTVDPIDGTANFAAGLPLFGVMAAAVAAGEVLAAAILDPIAGDIALARVGAGSWLEAADGSITRLRVAAAAPPAEMAGSVSWRFLPEPQRSLVCRNQARLAACFDYRCAAHQYRMAAAGHCHFVAFNRLLPWDHAPGWLLHREAGGYSARFDGSAYRADETAGGLLCAPDRGSWQALRAALLEP